MSEDAKIAFWLNCFNFLSVLGLLESMKCIQTSWELSKYYRSKSYLIGGHRLKLIEMANIVIEDKSIILDNTQIFGGNKSKSIFAPKKKTEFIDYGIFFPCKFGFK